MLVGKSNMFTGHFSSPFIRNKKSTSFVMFITMMCLLPGIATQIYFFGLGVLIQIILSIFFALLAETLCCYLMKKNILFCVKDGSTILTAILFAISIPPLSPWFLSAIGMLFAIVVVKYLYGGLGQNIFNPAMSAYVLLLIAFPVLMTQWQMPIALLSHYDMHTLFKIIFHSYNTLDGWTMATPLDTFKTELNYGKTTTEIATQGLIMQAQQYSWYWINMAFFLGGVILLGMQIIRWHLPIVFLMTLSLLVIVGNVVNPDHSPLWMFSLFSGATMLGAFFIITDPVSAPSSNKAKIVYAILIASLLYLIRCFGAYPDAIAFATLIANIFVPLLDHLIKNRTYGEYE